MLTTLTRAGRAVTMAALILLAGSAALARELDDVGSMRCGTQTISIGDTALAVQAACGPPSFTEQTTGYGLQTWAYNFGSTQFVHYLTIFQGRLQRIQVGSYGYVEAPSRGP